jgi:hypothetical protein
MSVSNLSYIRSLLSRLANKTLSSIASDELHLELIFEAPFRFQTHCSWRLFAGDKMLIGQGDVGSQIARDTLDRLIGLKILSVSVSNRFDTDFRFEGDYVLQAISDTMQYEVWDAHIEEGWVILEGGSIAIFPPAQTS